MIYDRIRCDDRVRDGRSAANAAASAHERWTDDGGPLFDRHPVVNDDRTDHAGGLVDGTIASYHNVIALLRVTLVWTTQRQREHPFAQREEVGFLFQINGIRRQRHITTENAVS